MRISQGSLMIERPLRFDGYSITFFKSSSIVAI